MHNHSSDLHGDGLHTLLAGVIGENIRQDRAFLGAFLKTGISFLVMKHCNLRL